MFRDKLNEIYVKFIKNALRHQNSALRHMTIARMVQSASVMASIHQHNLKARLLTLKKPRLGGRC